MGLRFPCAARQKDQRQHTIAPYPAVRSWLAPTLLEPRQLCRMIAHGELERLDPPKHPIAHGIIPNLDFAAEPVRRIRDRFDPFDDVLVQHPHLVPKIPHLDAQSLVAGAQFLLAGAQFLVPGAQFLLAGAQFLLAGLEPNLAGLESSVAGLESILAGDEAFLSLLDSCEPFLGHLCLTRADDDSIVWRLVLQQSLCHESMIAFADIRYFAHLGVARSSHSTVKADWTICNQYGGSQSAGRNIT